MHWFSGNMTRAVVDKQTGLAPDRAVSDANFDEQSYLYSNPDIAQAVAAGTFRDGAHPFLLHGRKEGSFSRRPTAEL